MLRGGTGTTGDDRGGHGKEREAECAGYAPVCDSVPQADQRHADSLSLRSENAV
jgi:hypothetical protein